MNLRDTARYRRDVVEVAAHYEAIRPALAIDFLTCLEEARSRLASHPRAFRERKEEVRIVLLRRFPYALRFRVPRAKDALRVLSLTHVARRPE
ncbi:MAG: hypothetical protein RIQ79_560 [Verrucomicrobiota bacterium]